MKVLQGNFRSYDVRGQCPEEIDETTAYAIGKAFSQYNPARIVVVGYDHRASTPALRDGLIAGLTDAGVHVWDIGQVTTDTTYFASWFYKEVQGAVMITASHMPAQFNGFKFIDRHYQPIGQGCGMEELFELASKIKRKSAVKTKGVVTKKDVMPDYLSFVWSFADRDAIKPLNVVMDCGNGVAGESVRKVFAPLQLAVTELCFEPDSTFPNHEANPIIPENRQHIEEAVLKAGADLGIAWDADADRAYAIDEKGQFVHGDFMTALLAKLFLTRKPGASIVYDLRASKVVEDTVAKAGGKAHMERVGHAHIKRRMRQEQAVFGGEVSGHYYFAANQYMDNGMIPVLMLLELVSRSGKPLSELIAELGDYQVSGEINSKVRDQKAAMQALTEKYRDAKQLTMDGVSIEYDDWRCNVRPSANDPVLRLNLEAKTPALMAAKRDEVLALIRQF